MSWLLLRLAKNDVEDYVYVTLR